METGYLAIVTGGAQGIGHGIAEALLQAGAKVGTYSMIIIKIKQKYSDEIHFLPTHGGKLRT